MLQELTDVVDRKRRKAKPFSKTGLQFITFVQEGEQGTKLADSHSLLHKSKSLDMRVYLDRRLVVPGVW